MKIKSALFCICTGLLVPVFGQSIIGATFPFGNQVQPNSGMSFAMGGTSCAVAPDYNGMLTNPANLACLDKTVFSALVTAEFMRLSEPSDHTNVTTVLPQQIAVGIPLGKFGTMGLAYNQRENERLSVRYDTSFSYDGTPLSFYKGMAKLGGISVWQLGYGYSIQKILQVGASYEHAYYSSEISTVESIYDNTGAYPDNPSRDSTKIRSTFDGFRGGVTISLKKLRLGLSGEYFLKSNATADSAVYPSNSIVPTPNTIGQRTITLKMPPSLFIGCAYDFSAEWLAAADVSLTYWDHAQTENAIDVSTLTGVSVGAQYIPAPNILTPKYYEIVRYRAGLRYTQLPADQAYEAMLSLGAGLPIGKGSGMLDVGVEIGRRASGVYPNLKEDVVRFGIGFNGGRKWNKSSRSNY